VFKRPDGKMMALIEDSKSGESAFYTSEDDLFGIKVGRIATDQIDVNLGDGSSVTLKLGTPEIFDGGVHAD